MLIALLVAAAFLLLRSGDSRSHTTAFSVQDMIMIDPKRARLTPNGLSLLKTKLKARMAKPYIQDGRLLGFDATFPGGPDFTVQAFDTLRESLKMSSSSYAFIPPGGTVGSSAPNTQLANDKLNILFITGSKADMPEGSAYIGDFAELDQIKFFG